jgi:hypothetical protein
MEVVKGSDHIIESNRSRPLRFGRLFRDDDCEEGKIDWSSSSSDFDNMLDSSLWRIRVRVSGGPSWMKLNRSAVGSTGLAKAMAFVDWRLSEFERDWRLLLVVEVEVDVEAVVEDVDSADWSDFCEPFRVAPVGSGVEERLLKPLALRIWGLFLREVSSAAVETWVSTKSLGSSGVVDGQLESELSSEDLTVGVLAREFDVVVFVERDLEEGRGSCAGSVCWGWISSSMTSTTCPSGATTS